jgi:hypothetical protein
MEGFYCTCCVMSHGLGQHGLAAAGGAVHEHAARGVDADLFVELVVRQRQLHRLPDLLLLHVHATDVCVLHVRLLVCSQQQQQQHQSGEHCPCRHVLHNCI